MVQIKCYIEEDEEEDLIVNESYLFLLFVAAIIKYYQTLI
jgi:hypothetical protein